MAVGPSSSGEVLGFVSTWFLGEDHRRTGLPFYCDPARVGYFAVEPAALATGDDSAVFQFFITLAMYQALRDVVIMRQQRSMSGTAVRVLADSELVGSSVANHSCPTLRSSELFEQGCDVSKLETVVDCETLPGSRCHVKDATLAFNRMGDMGKLPTSAWLRLWKDGGVGAVLAEICRKEASPTKRAALLVERFTAVHRVGRKLATMFVSAMSTPALAPGLTPWFPEVDGNELVVIDTNVARAVDALREPGGPKTYDARATWLREQSAHLDLRELRADLPRYSPRLVQEALYTFCSRSNRVARGDRCGEPGAKPPCEGCCPLLCPFVREGDRERRAVNHRLALTPLGEPEL